MLKKLERGVQAKIDKLPPGVSSFLDLKTSEFSIWLVCANLIAVTGVASVQ